MEQRSKQFNGGSIVISTGEHSAAPFGEIFHLWGNDKSHSSETHLSDALDVRLSSQRSLGIWDLSVTTTLFYENTTRTQLVSCFLTRRQLRAMRDALNEALKEDRYHEAEAKQDFEDGRREKKRTMKIAAREQARKDRKRQRQEGAAS